MYLTEIIDWLVFAHGWLRAIFMLISPYVYFISVDFNEFHPIVFLLIILFYL